MLTAANNFQKFISRNKFCLPITTDWEKFSKLVPYELIGKTISEKNQIKTIYKKKQKTEVKMSHVNKKPLARKVNLVQKNQA